MSSLFLPVVHSLKESRAHEGVGCLPIEGGVIPVLANAIKQAGMSRRETR